MPPTLDLDRDGTVPAGRMPGAAGVRTVTPERGTIPALAPDGPDLSGGGAAFAPECADARRLFI